MGWLLDLIAGGILVIGAIVVCVVYFHLDLAQLEHVLKTFFAGSGLSIGVV